MTTPGGGQPGLPGTGAEDTKNIAGELAGWMKNPAGGILAAAFNVLSAIFGKGSNGIDGIIEWVDGQTAYNNRTDLLSPLQDYGSVYMNGAQGWSQTGEMPFTNQIGPMTGCRRNGSRIVLDDKGLWDINAQLWFDYIDILTGEVQWRIEVLRPNGTIYSQMQSRLDTKNPVSSTNLTSVVVPDPGYQVRVWVNYIANFRGILGGPNLNRLTVKHISRRTDVGDTGQG